MSHVYKIVCEYDIGQEYYSLFSSYELAHQWATVALASCGLEETLEELENEGLFEIEGLLVIESLE